jgi:hypothetical protein
VANWVGRPGAARLSIMRPVTLLVRLLCIVVGWREGGVGRMSARRLEQLGMTVAPRQGNRRRRVACLLSGAVGRSGLRVVPWWCGSDAARAGATESIIIGTRTGARGGGFSYLLRRLKIKAQKRAGAPRARPSSPV